MKGCQEGYGDKPIGTLRLDLIRTQNDPIDTNEFHLEIYEDKNLEKRIAKLDILAIVPREVFTD